MVLEAKKSKIKVALLRLFFLCPSNRGNWKRNSDQICFTLDSDYYKDRDFLINVIKSSF